MALGETVSMCQFLNRPDNSDYGNYWVRNRIEITSVTPHSACLLA